MTKDTARRILRERERERMTVYDHVVMSHVRVDAVETNEARDKVENECKHSIGECYLCDNYRIASGLYTRGDIAHAYTMRVNAKLRE